MLAALALTLASNASWAGGTHKGGHYSFGEPGSDERLFGQSEEAIDLARALRELEALLGQTPAAKPKKAAPKAAPKAAKKAAPKKAVAQKKS